MRDLLFCWMNSFMWVGYRRPLQNADMCDLPPTFDGSKNAAKLNIKSSVGGALFRLYYKRWLCLGVLQLLIVLSDIASKWLLGYFFENKTNFTLVWASTCFALSVFTVVSNSTYFFDTMSTGIRIRSALISLLYDKTLRLSPTAAQDVGKITNVVSNDVTKVAEFYSYIHHLWSSPLQIIIVTGLLYNMLGVFAFLGLGVQVVYMVLQRFTITWLIRYRKRVVVLADMRVKLINEALHGIRIIKMLAWEDSFCAEIAKIRAKEARIISIVNILKGAINGVSYGVPTLAIILVFFVNSTPINTDTAFTCVALFFMLRLPVLFVPMMISNALDARISLNRISALLNAEEISSQPEIHKAGPSALIVNGSFDWGSTSLSDLSLEIKSGALVGLVGRVGQGKSSVLSAIVGEMPRVSGSVDIFGKIAYCPQKPWILNCSLRENILFGSRFCEERYRRALELSCLVPDLESLPNGDMTEIGEHGVNLSGGQKARVSFARALYSDADIYILDDPLSAVDTHVGAQLFNGTICTSLKEKTVILATHALYTLPKCDYVYRIEDLKISETSLNEVKDSEETLNVDIAKLDTSKGSLMQTEERAEGGVSKKVYKYYMDSCGGPYFAILVLAIGAASQAMSFSSYFFLKKWINAPDKALNMDGIVTLVLGTSQMLALCISSALFGVFCAIGARRIHNGAIKGVFASPVNFFDTTPLGRIINRFSRDQNNVDYMLPESLRMLIMTLMGSISSLINACVYEPWLILMLCPFLLGMYFVQKFYRRTSRELQRLYSLSLSPLFAHLSETLSGLTTIRAYRNQRIFQERNDNFINSSNKPKFFQIAAQRWLSIRMEITACIIFYLMCIITFLLKSENLELVVSLSLQITSQLNWSVRQATETEVFMNSVERLAHYSCELEKEETNEITNEVFPLEGNVEFGNVSLFYNDLPALLNVSFSLKKGTRLGVVGRTGAGKSSLIAALFRLVEPKGKILIDGMDISKLHLSELRKNIGIIPQDPVLFAGSIRSNVDRFNKYSDEKIWETLSQCGLKEFASSLTEKLEYNVTENGENMSVGQRQLLCLARTLIGDYKILVLDEVTASVDHATDEQIQRSLRNVKCTVITIAHRLETIIDYDCILVLDGGKVVEYNNPQVLAADPVSAFSSLINETGDQNAALLRRKLQQKRIY